ncbi:MAG TPA: hypothetical protein VIG24_17530, partial [Acidimicrobiia bacterium]
MPFGPYEDFADCVSKNQDKSNPEAYCGYLESMLKPESMQAVPGGGELPEAYRPATSDDVPEGQACGNCLFYNEANVRETAEGAIEVMCDYWAAYVRGDHYCNAWQAAESETTATMSRMRFKVIAVPETFVDEDGDGLDDVTGEPVEETDEPEAQDDAPEDDAPEADMDEMGNKDEDFHTLLVVEGIWTGDGRWIEEEALSWRNLPLPLMGLDKTTEAHMEARLIGNITRIERQGRELHGWGSFVESDDDDVLGLQGLIRRGELRGVSVDLDAVEYEVLMPEMSEPYVDEGT